MQASANYTKRLWLLVSNGSVLINKYTCYKTRKIVYSAFSLLSFTVVIAALSVIDIMPARSACILAIIVPMAFIFAVPHPREYPISKENSVKSLINFIIFAIIMALSLGYFKIFH